MEYESRDELVGVIEQHTSLFHEMAALLPSSSFFFYFLIFDFFGRRTPTQDLSPAQMTQDSSLAIPPRRISLLSRPFGLGWRDKNKVSLLLLILMSIIVFLRDMKI